MDNCADHKLTYSFKRAEDIINTEIRYLDPSLTDVYSPVALFLSKKIKEAWYGMREKHKMNMIMSGKCSDSWKISNPGNKFFLNLSIRAISKVHIKATVTTYCVSESI